MSYCDEKKIRVIACDLCGRTICLSDRRFHSDMESNYLSIPMESEGLVYERHVCEDCIAKIITKKFGIGKGGIKDGTV